MARTNPPYYNEEEDEQTRREDELLARGMNPDLANEDDGSTILSGGINPDLSTDDNDFASAWDNLFKAGEGTPLATPTTPAAAPLGGVTEAQQRLDEAAAKSNEAYSSLQGIANDWLTTLEQRREEARPRFTQEELDSRRAKSTALSTLTSALANIANGLTVGAGGLNATVPDGYQAAYEHWNDVQKRHDMRQAEFDKLTDAIYTKKYGMSKADYERLEAERKEARQDLAQQRNIDYGLEKAHIQSETSKANNAADNQARMERLVYDREHPKPTATRSSGGGGRRSTGGSSSSKAAGNSFSYNGTDYTIPSGVTTKQAMDKIADSAIKKLKEQKSGYDTDLDDAEIKAIDKAITAINNARNGSGTLTDAKMKSILKALNDAGYDGDDIQDILDGLAPQQPSQPTQQRRNNNSSSSNGNGGTRSNDSGLF